MSAPLSLHCYMESMGTSVWECVCLKHASSAPIPWLECVHASVLLYAGETPLTGDEKYLIGQWRH